MNRNHVYRALLILPIFTSCSSGKEKSLDNDWYDYYTPERIVEGSGIKLPEYAVKYSIDDKGLAEDSVRWKGPTRLALGDEENFSSRAFGQSGLKWRALGLPRWRAATIFFLWESKRNRMQNNMYRKRQWFYCVCLLWMEKVTCPTLSACTEVWCKRPWPIRRRGRHLPKGNSCLFPEMRCVDRGRYVLPRLSFSLGWTRTWTARIVHT